MHRCMNEMNSETQASSSSEAARTSRPRLACNVMRQNPTRAKVVRPYVGLEKQARKHISGSKPNYRDMPADVSVKEPSKGSLGGVSRNHRTESSKGLYSRRREHEVTDKTATSDSSTCTIVAGLTEQSSILLFFLPI